MLSPARLVQRLPRTPFPLQVPRLCRPITTMCKEHLLPQTHLSYLMIQPALCAQLTSHKLSPATPAPSSSPAPRASARARSTTSSSRAARTPSRSPSHTPPAPRAPARPTACTTTSSIWRTSRTSSARTASLSTRSSAATGTGPARRPSRSRPPRGGLCSWISKWRFVASLFPLPPYCPCAPSGGCRERD